MQYFRKCLRHGVSRLLSGVFKNRWQFRKILVVNELSTGENLEGLCLGTVLLYQKFGSGLGHRYALNINGRPTDHSRAMGFVADLSFKVKERQQPVFFPRNVWQNIVSKQGTEHLCSSGNMHDSRLCNNKLLKVYWVSYRQSSGNPP